MMHRISCRHGATAMRRVINTKQRFKSTSNTATTAAAAPPKAAASVPKEAKEDMTTKIGGSIVAAILGVTTVSLAAAGVESSTGSTCPPYSAGGQRFSQAEFSGRFCRMLLACDPRLLFYSDEQVQQASKLLQDASQYSQDRTMDRTLWEAKRMMDAALHPDTGETIPRPFRMSGFVPYNGPICVSMIASTSTIPLLFWSWINQSQNALVNYYNRNASAPMSSETLAMSYTAAVGSALAVAFGLATFIQKRYPAPQAKNLMKWVAFPSAITASSLNCYIVRSPEIDSGVPLLDQHGRPVSETETSQEAAKRGVHSTTLTRAILQAPVYFLPPLIMIPLQKTLLKNYPALGVPVTTYLLLTSFGIGLPCTIALFPQIAEIDASEVEAKFQHLRDPDTDAPYKVFYYNKGL